MRVLMIEQKKTNKTLTIATAEWRALRTWAQGFRQLLRAAIDVSE